MTHPEALARLRVLAPGLAPDAARIERLAEAVRIIEAHEAFENGLPWRLH